MHTHTHTKLNGHKITDVENHFSLQKLFFFIIYFYYDIMSIMFVVVEFIVCFIPILVYLDKFIIYMCVKPCQHLNKYAIECLSLKLMTKKKFMLRNS